MKKRHFISENLIHSIIIPHIQSIYYLKFFLGRTHFNLNSELYKWMAFCVSNTIKGSLRQSKMSFWQLHSTKDGKHERGQGNCSLLGRNIDRLFVKDSVMGFIIQYGRMDPLKEDNVRKTLWVSVVIKRFINFHPFSFTVLFHNYSLSLYICI